MTHIIHIILTIYTSFIFFLQRDDDEEGETVRQVASLKEVLKWFSLKENKVDYLVLAFSLLIVAVFSCSVLLLAVYVSFVNKYIGRHDKFESKRNCRQKLSV